MREIATATLHEDDRRPHAMLLRPKPAPGEEYIDEDFGTPIRRITDALEGIDTSNQADADLAVVKPMYSTMPAWNADESMLLLWSRKRGHMLFEGDAPYRFVRLLNPYHPTDIESVLWDPYNPQVLYYPSNYRAEPKLIRHHLKTGPTVLQDFAAPPWHLPVGDWTTLLSLGGDPQWLGRGARRFIGLRCGALTFAYSIAEEQVYALHAMPDFKNALMVTPSENFIQLDRFVFDFNMTLSGACMLGMAKPYEHGCPGLLEDGVDVWNCCDFDHPTRKGSLVSYRVDTGACTVVVGPLTGYPFPPSGTHISSIGPPEWAAVGIIGSGNGRTLLDNELLMANVRTRKVYRIGHARTLAGNGRWGYWGETHVNISPSGTRVLFGSDWMGSDSVDTYVVDLRKRP